MANTQIGNSLGVAAVAGKDINGGNDGLTGWVDGVSVGAELSVTSLRARLAVVNAGLYTAAYLNNMSYNDLVYALRLADAPTTVR